MSGLKDSCHFFIQSEVQPKPIVTRLHVFSFSRALRQLPVITSSFDWLITLSVSFVIGQSNYFGFGVMTLKRKLVLIYKRHTLCTYQWFAPGWGGGGVSGNPGEI